MKTIAGSKHAPRSLASRLTGAYAATFMVLLGLTFAVLFAGVRSIIDARVDDDLDEDVEELALAWERGGDGAVIEEIVRETAAGDSEEVFLMLLDETGAVVHASDLAFFPGAAVASDRLAAAFERGEEQFATERYPDRDAAARTIVASLSPSRALYLAESYEERDEIMQVLLVAFAAVFLLAIPVASAIAWWLARRAAGGIRAVSTAANEIRDGHRDVRVDSHGQAREVAELADAFNAMAERNQKLIADMRDMTDNIAHDLRSPLTRVRMIAEDALCDATDLSRHQQAAAAIVGECDRLTRMINVALDVSEAEAGISRVPYRPLALSTLVADVVDLYTPLADERGVALSCRSTVQLQARGDREALERVVANLVDNGVKFTPRGGRIDVVITRHGELAVVDVVDTGVGIPADALARVFDRYFRVDDSRSGGGTGLGLAYARAVARAHGGDIVVTSRPLHETRFRLTVPLADSIVHDRRSPLARRASASAGRASPA